MATTSDSSRCADHLRTDAEPGVEVRPFLPPPGAVSAAFSALTDMQVADEVRRRRHALAEAESVVNVRRRLVDDAEAELRRRFEKLVERLGG